MYYKIEKGSKVYDEFKLIFDRGSEYNEAAKSLVEKLGYQEYGRFREKAFGGLDFIVNDVKPDGFKAVDRKKGWYAPLMKAKAIQKQFKNLPVITREEFNEVVGFEIHLTRQGFISDHFGWSYVNEIFLIETHTGCRYKPKEGVIKISKSEYYQLEVKS